jgi:hypothetical protein
MAAGDFDGDGRPDLALTSHDHNEAVVLRGDGAGGFAPFPASPVRFLERPRAHNHGLAAGDVDGDGRLDLATADQDDKSVSVVLGDGSGAFTPAAGSPFAVAGGSYPLALADLNGDRALDIVTPNVTASSITVLLGDGRGGFAEAPGSPHAVHPRPYFIAVGHLDGDPALDVVASHDDSEDLSILLGDGAGGLGAPRRVSLGGRGWKVRIADMNGDGRSDIVTGIARGSVVILHGDGSGGFRQAPGSPVRVGDGPWGVAVGDVNHDGRPDVVTANLESNDLSVLLSR